MNVAPHHEVMALHEVVQGMAEASLLVDQDGCILVANASAASLFGYPVEQLEGHPVELLVPEHLRATHQVHLSAFVDHPVPRQMVEAGRKTPALRRDGEMFDAKVSLSPMRHGTVLVTVVDVSMMASTTEALRKYSMILEQMGSAVVITDAAGDIEYVNPGFERATGYALSEVKGHNPRLLQSGQTPRATLDALHTALLHGQAWQGEFRNRRKDGSVYWEQAIISPIKDSEGRVTHFAAVMDDVSTRKEAEIALSRREHLLRLFIEHVPIALAMLDRDMCYVSVSQRWIIDYGLANTPLIGRSHYEVFPELPAQWKRVHQRCLSGASERMEEECFTRQDGSRMWLRWEIRPWYQAPGEVGGILIFTEDITERKTSELAVSSSEERFRATFEQAAVGIAHVAPDGRWIRVNQRLCQILRYSHEALLRTTFQNVTYPDDAHADEVLRQQLIDGVIDHYGLQKRYVRQNGEPIWARLTVSLVRSSKGQADYFIYVVEDIDVSKRAELELQHLRGEMEQVLASHIAIQTAVAIAHELNQPLNAIASYTEAALRLHHAGNHQHDRVAHALRAAAAQAQRAGGVIRELMQLLHKRQTTSELIDLNRVINEAVAIVQSSQLSPAEIKVELQPDLGPVLAHRLQIEKVMTNLLNNSLEAMKSAGMSLKRIRVSVSSMDADGMALVSVQDSGPGLTADAASSIFLPFFSTKKKGLGMGLAVSRALIEAHGGKLWLDLNDGPGATFRFTLPLAP